MKKIILTLIASLTFIWAFSQDMTQTVKGKIIDIDNHMPLIGAAIVVIDSDPLIGTTTDIDGNFKLENIPVGRQSFKISYLGYETAYRKDVAIGSGKEVILNIEMKESVMKVKEVVITGNKNKGKANNSMAHTSVHQISVEETSRIAAGINDPARTAQSLAGVATSDDENNELVIRGNSPRGILWRMEGIEIPNPNHFSNGEGGSGGAISALSTQVLANSDFYTAAFPAEYGNALSGVFDLKLRKGNSDKNEYALQLGILGAQLAAEGPFSKKSDASYLINYRYSTLTMFSAIGIDISGGDIIPEFQDVSFKIYVPTKNAGNFSIWGLGAISTAGRNPFGDTSLWVYNGDSYGENEKHKMGVTGITHNYLLKNNKSYLRTVAAVSFNQNLYLLDSVNHSFKETTLNDNNFSYHTASVNSYFNHKFNSKNVIRVGGIYTYQGFNLSAKSLNTTENVLEQLISNEGNTSYFETYMHLKHRFSEKFEMALGYHQTYLFLNEDLSLEPRMSFEYKINELHTINFCSGLHSRLEPISIYLAEKHLPNGEITLPNKNLGTSRAAHFVLGHNWILADNLRLKSEVYYQYLYDVPVQDNDTTGTISSLNFATGFTNELMVNKGTGKNYGIELTLEKFFSDNYYFMATASIFDSKYTMPDGTERNTRYNCNYIFNATGGKEFMVGKDKQNVLGVNIRTIWKGGQRIIPVDFENSIKEGEEVLVYEDAFENRTSDYFRVDLGVSFRKNKPKYSWIVSLDLQNATNRLNVYTQYYNPVEERVENYYLLGLLPVLNYRLEF
jgi:hypothetical protein